MLQIGDFSQLAQISIKTLRYYDEIGLLKPKFIDPQTHYRYYGVDQLPRLNRIVALKEIGFALDQILRLLNEEVSSDQLKGMLKLRQAEAEQAMQAELARLARIQARLDQIEREGQPSKYDVIIKTVPTVTIAYTRQIIPTYADVGRLFGILFATPLQAISPPLVIYHDGEYHESNPDIEAAVVIANAENVTNSRQLEAATMATTIHQGSYETLHLAYAALMDWLENSQPQHPRISSLGTIREHYLRGYGSSNQPITPDQFITEIQIPIQEDPR